MEIINPSDHQLLTYAFAVQGHGYTLTQEEFGAYAASPSRRLPVTKSRWLEPMLSVLGSFGSHEVVSPGETRLQHFDRVGWVTVQNGRVRVTQLGQAVVKAADAGTGEEEIIQTTLDPTDPLAYARLVSRLSQLDDVLVVDPYFRSPQLLELFELPSITRVLTSHKVGEADQASLRTTARAIQWGRTFEIRAAAEQGVVHDRYLISDKGPVFQVGASLNSIGRAFTVLSQLQDVAEEVRQRFEGLWEKATVIYPTEGEVVDERGDAAPVI